MNSTDARSLTDRIATELREAGTAERAASEKRYLKSELEHYGATVPVIGKAAGTLLKELPDISREQLLGLVTELWSRQVHELRMLAVELLCHRGGMLEPGDIDLLERLLRESRTWALVDTLAVKVVGPLVRRHNGLKGVLERWSRDDDFWLRRSVLLAFLLPMRAGKPGVFEEFAAYADGMLEEREFFIRKAIGWVLRERTKREPEEVFRWLEPRAGRASRLTLREASKHLPEEQRKVLLERGKQKRAS